MPDAKGRVPPVAFSLTDAEWQRIFGDPIDEEPESEWYFCQLCGEDTRAGCWECNT